MADAQTIININMINNNTPALATANNHAPGCCDCDDTMSGATVLLILNRWQPLA
jgi:hypothetical protein